MNKAFVSLLVVLLAGGAITAVMMAKSARAQTEPRRPQLVAMMLPHLPISAAPTSQGGGPLARPAPGAIAARRGQICRDQYAHEVGDLAYLEARLSLTPPQQPLFDRWKAVKLDIAKRGQADCTTRELPRGNARPSPLDSMAREEDGLKRRIADLDAERPALAALYSSLSPGQRGILFHPAALMSGGPMMGRHFGAGDHGGPADRPSPPSPQ